MSAVCNICSNKCFGIEGYDGSCCSIENRDYIIGPISDPDDFIDRLSNHLGRKVNKDSVFINYESGRQMFPDKVAWQNPENYPALRIDFNSTKLPCIFYNTSLKFCTVHSIRPRTCRDYFCGYLADSLNPGNPKIQQDPKIEGGIFET